MVQRVLVHDAGHDAGQYPAPWHGHRPVRPVAGVKPLRQGRCVPGGERHGFRCRSSAGEQGLTPVQALTDVHTRLR